MSSQRSASAAGAQEDEDVRGPPPGPITQYHNYRQYLEENKVPQMFQSLMASLMMERPEDMFAYLDTKLEAIKNIGPENIDWETFVYRLHPTRDPVREQLVKGGKQNADDLPFSGLNPSIGRMQPREEERSKELVEVEEEKEAEQVEKDVEEEDYQPDVFQLTEALDDEDDDHN